MIRLNRKSNGNKDGYVSVNSAEGKIHDLKFEIRVPSIRGTIVFAITGC